jgi:hypothetical protein
VLIYLPYTFAAYQRVLSPCSYLTAVFFLSLTFGARRISALQKGGTLGNFRPYKTAGQFPSPFPILLQPQNMLLRSNVRSRKKAAVRYLLRQCNAHVQADSKKYRLRTETLRCYSICCYLSLAVFFRANVGFSAVGGSASGGSPHA